MFRLMRRINQQVSDDECKKGLTREYNTVILMVI